VSGSGASNGGSASSASGAAGTAGAGGNLAGSGGGGAGANAGGSATGGAGAGGTSAGGTSAGASGAGGAPGPTSCAGHAISMAMNTTGSEKDVAHALVSIDLAADLPIGNSDRTIEFWMYVKPTDWVAEVNEIYVYGTVGKLQQVGLDFGLPAVKGMPTNHATLGPYTDGIFDDDTGVDLGLSSAAPLWFHVAMTYDGANTTLRTYVNGALEITTKPLDNTKLLTTASPFYLGCNPPYYGCFSGLFDELRIWNVRRSDAEIMAAYNKALVGNEPGLVGYYKFNEAPGSLTAADSVTTAGHVAHTGTLMAATPTAVPTFVTPDPLPNVACP
jgi:Concanavalin A-like lectin/glucanases superfamily